MSYKSLLFCPDEKAARVVTQVLSELEFTVELSNEPFATVKKLTDEHFDALVVDCQNEQDAALLFKGARNSSLNHSSLSVAVVEGQTGVAKAFRIGANLVLTKPINIEQSKSTLRVARGLLRKNEAKPGFSPAAATPKSSSAFPPLPAKPFAQEPATFPAASQSVLKPITSASSAPFAALELEQEPTPAPEAAEVAMLESMPDLIDGKPAPAAEPMWAPRSQSPAEPIAASTAGQAAAAAPALEKPTELKFAGASPMVTQEPIVKETGATEHFPVASVPVPTFSSLETHASSSSDARKFIKNVVVLLILGVAGYMAWQKLQPLQYLHRSGPVQSVTQPAPIPAPSAPSAPVPAAPSAAELDTRLTETTPSAATSDLSTASGSSTASGVPTTSARAFTPETIRVQELPMSDQKTSAAPKPQLIVVKTKPGSPGAPKPVQQPPAPALSVSSANNSDAALASIVSTDAGAAKPALGSFRVSQGVSQGLVVKKVAPVYPATALQLHKQGAVELVATISKDGAVTSVKVLSGDLMLANAAVEAVRQWKYRPYLLNGEPVEIETQITVNFRLPR